jgi:hypothetical protein
MAGRNSPFRARPIELLEAEFTCIIAPRPNLTLGGADVQIDDAEYRGYVWFTGPDISRRLPESLYLNGALLTTNVEFTPTLPPVLQGSFLYHGGFANPCLPAACVQYLLTGFYPYDTGPYPTTVQFAGGNELVTITEPMSAEAFQNHNGSLGRFIGTFYMTGTMSITYEGRSSATQLGTFPTLLTSLDYSGSFGSHTFETRLNTGLGASSGVTHLSDVFFWNGLHGYGVDSNFSGFAESSLDNGPFVPSEIGFGLYSPEPGSAGMTVLGFVGLAVVASRIPRSSRNP